MLKPNAPIHIEFEDEPFKPVEPAYGTQEVGHIFAGVLRDVEARSFKKRHRSQDMRIDA